ncbi:MAG: hypothetical protein Ct9H300mP10_06210 [Methanobacteriota archaeon]|nr:MAG: hypothetical protein Ct9H300mP10_06210 [Euryarchaeota archaeon]
MESLGIQKADLGLPGAGPFHVGHIDAMLTHMGENGYSLPPGCAVRTVVSDIEPLVNLQAKHERQFPGQCLPRDQPHPPVRRGLDDGEDHLHGREGRVVRH